MYVSRLILVAGALALAVFSSHSLAEPAQKAPDQWLLAKYDTNGDRVISLDEVSGKRAKLFGYMDDDQDGQVSFDEYQHLDTRKRQLLLRARFEKLDLDGDGELSSAEYGSYLGSFERFDRNGDGYISPEEMAGRPLAKDDAPEDQPYCVLWVCLRSSIH